MRLLKISFEEEGRHIYDTVIIGKEITEDQANRLIEKGIAHIEEKEVDEGA